MCTSFDGLARIFDLEDVSVGTAAAGSVSCSDGRWWRGRRDRPEHWKRPLSATAAELRAPGHLSVAAAAITHPKALCRIPKPWLPGIEWDAAMCDGVRSFSGGAGREHGVGGKAWDAAARIWVALLADELDVFWWVWRWVGRLRALTGCHSCDDELEADKLPQLGPKRGRTGPLAPSQDRARGAHHAEAGT